MRQHGLHPVQRRLHVDRHHLIELVVGHLAHEARDPASRVVDPDIDAAEPVQRRIAKALDLRSRGHVGDDRQRIRTEARGQRLQFVLPPGGQHDAISAGDRLCGDRGPDAGAGAGHNDGPGHDYRSG